jgi:hypothetical protein
MQRATLRVGAKGEFFAGVRQFEQQAGAVVVNGHPPVRCREPEKPDRDIAA